MYHVIHMQDNFNNKKNIIRKNDSNQTVITMVLDVVELQVLLINHDHRLSNVWDCEMKQSLKNFIKG